MITKEFQQCRYKYRLSHKLVIANLIQVISTYSLPDTAELNYHAGTALRSKVRSIHAVHSGVQFCDKQAEQLTAFLLLYIRLQRERSSAAKHTVPVR